MLKLVDLPYGGSITFASMLPILLIAYRHGTSWGLLTASVHGILQFILGTSVLSYVTGWASIVAVIVLDYFLAFALIGLAGLFKNMKSQKAALVLGGLTVGIARYACHVISGATVWAGLSIPTGDALAYSFVYNDYTMGSDSYFVNDLFLIAFDTASDKQIYTKAIHMTSDGSFTEKDISQWEIAYIIAGIDDPYENYLLINDTKNRIKLFDLIEGVIPELSKEEFDKIIPYSA
jgi:energy-coupled thiamine transporter ThiT